VVEEKQIILNKSLNYSKTTYLLFNKQPHQLVSTQFMVYVNQKEILCSESVKYLGVFIDDKLS